MPQVIVIHGGDSFLTYRAYLRFLKTVPVSRQSWLPSRGWKANLPTDLGRGYEVLQPRMPNAMNAHYREWVIWLRRMLPFVKRNAILIGHSQGGLFLVKYLSEHAWPKPIGGLFLVAPPHNSTKGVGDFRITGSLRRIRQQCKHITFIYSRDDTTVPIREMKKYQPELPEAEYVVFEKRGHFRMEHFPELVRRIRHLKG